MTPSNKQPRPASSDFDARLGAYCKQASLAAKIAELRDTHSEKLGLACTLSAAAGAALSMTPAAEAAIRYSGIVNDTVERDNPAIFAYPGPPQITYGAFGNFAITNTSGSTVGRFALAARIFNVYGYLGIAAFGSTPAIYNHCNSACGPTDPNFQVLGGPRPSNGVQRVIPVPEGTPIDANGVAAVQNTNSGGTVPVSLTFFDQLPTQGNDDRTLRKVSYGSEAGEWHLWEGSPGTFSAGEFVGIKLNISDQDHYGWIRIAIANEDHPDGTAGGRNGTPYAVRAIDWAYETTPNTPINAGATGAAVVTTGDYNGDGRVDAADYTVWRDTYGQTVPAGTGADGDGSGMIDDGDHTFWAERYGDIVPPPSGSATIPEPSSAAVIGLGVLALGAKGVRRHRRAVHEANQT